MKRGFNDVQYGAQKLDHKTLVALNSITLTFLFPKPVFYLCDFFTVFFSLEWIVNKSEWIQQEVLKLNLLFIFGI